MHDHISPHSSTTYTGSGSQGSWARRLTWVRTQRLHRDGIVIFDGHNYITSTTSSEFGVFHRHGRRDPNNARGYTAANYLLGDWRVETHELTAPTPT